MSVPETSTQNLASQNALQFEKGPDQAPEDPLNRLSDQSKYVAQGSASTKFDALLSYAQNKYGDFRSTQDPQRLVELNGKITQFLLEAGQTVPHNVVQALNQVLKDNDQARERDRATTCLFEAEQALRQAGGR